MGKACRLAGTGTSQKDQEKCLMLAKLLPVILSLEHLFYSPQKAISAVLLFDWTLSYLFLCILDTEVIFILVSSLLGSSVKSIAGGCKHILVVLPPYTPVTRGAAGP